MKQSIYDFSLRRLDGRELLLKEFRNKKMLIVNVASECGFTGQYQQLQELYQTYQDKLEIIGCPCDDFGGQEPGSSEQIEQFCTMHYGVTFPITEKMSIVNGFCHPLYQWLMDDRHGIDSNNMVRWNFQKYLIGDNGELIAVFDPSISPFDDRIIDWIGEKSEVG